MIVTMINTRLRFSSFFFRSVINGVVHHQEKKKKKKQALIAIRSSHQIELLLDQPDQSK